jgi:carboxyl-terminal processing protease
MKIQKHKICSAPRYKNTKIKLLFELSLLIFFLTPTFVFAGSLEAGDLVKLENLPSVYYIQADGTRLVFPNEAVYKSHYDNFDNVKTVSPEELRNYPLAGNAALKEGSLVKFSTSNKVYQVKSNKELEWIKTESGFKNLGYDFSQVIVLPEIFFTDYKARAVNSSYDEVLEILKSNFIYQERLEDLEDIASSAEGLVEALNDEYSTFWDADEYNEFMEWINNDSFEGIGAEVQVKDGRLIIVTPLDGSPAQAAGLKAGDEVKFIDNYDASGININKAVMLIRGDKGTTVTLRVQRKGINELIAIPIVRDTIVVPQFSWEAQKTPLNRDVVYLDLSQFSQGAWRDFVNASDEILAQEPAGMILDLRNNPGGYLAMAIDIASKWLSKDKVVMIERKANQLPIQYLSNQFNYYLGTPLVILVNKGSASASEIVAGALQENEVAILIGEQTFGKGVVQNIVPLSDGNVIKITISEWFTPNDNQINGEGIVPDIIIEQGDDIEVDEQLDSALNKLDEIIEIKKLETGN